MSIQLFSRPVDGTIPVAALLYDDEALLATQQGVGLYDGPSKSPAHQSGSAHVTTHRLFFITDDDAVSTGGPDPPYGRGHSLAFPLHVVAETQYYAGFFKSSAKITLALHSPSSTINSNTNDGTSSNDLASWECQICAYRNPPGLSPSARSICALCGVPRQQPAEDTRASLDPSPELEPIPCPACTFHNHPSRTHCEICGTQLPPSSRANLSASTPTSRPDSPGDDVRPNQAHSIRLSFRKGGDKVFYSHLKRALLGKAWEVNKLSGGKNGNVKKNSGPSDPNPPNQPTNSREGINHILHTLSTTSTTTSASLTHAFADLEIFMAQARDMVRFAEDLGRKLETLEKRGAAATAAESPSILSPSPNSNDQNAKATIIRSSLAQLGLQSRLHVSAPLSSSGTPSGLPPPSSAYGDSNGTDRDKDEQAWLAGLARELAVVLQGPNESKSRRGDPFEQNGNGNTNTNTNTTSRTGLSLPNPSLKLNNVDLDLSRTDSVAPGREGEGEGTVGIGMMRTREIVSLDEVWGAWNRARGVSLIPPPTLLQTLPHLPTHTTPPIHARTLRSGLVVLHTPRYGQEEVVRRLLAAIRRGSGRPRPSGYTHTLDGTEDDEDMTNSTPLDSGKGLTTPSFAHYERLPISLIADLVLEAEASGVVCRDAGGAGFGLSAGVDADLDSVVVGGGGGGAKSTSTSTGGVVGKLSAFVGKVGAGAGIGGAAGGGVDESAYLSTDVRWYVNVWRDYVWDGQV